MSGSLQGDVSHVWVTSGRCVSCLGHFRVMCLMSGSLQGDVSHVWVTSG